MQDADKEAQCALICITLGYHHVAKCRAFISATIEAQQLNASMLAAMLCDCARLPAERCPQVPMQICWTRTAAAALLCPDPRCRSAVASSLGSLAVEAALAVVPPRSRLLLRSAGIW